MCGRATSIAALLLVPLLLIMAEPARTGSSKHDIISSPNVIDGAQRYIYKRAGQFDLPIFLFVPDKQAGPQPKTAAVVFFHGSGWRAGSVSQFAAYARQLSEHGIVAALAEYRVKDDYNATPFDGLGDVRSAIRWLRKNASEFMLDEQKIVAAGASSGGHLALSAALFADDRISYRDEQAISSVPDALVLFSTVVNTSEEGYRDSEGLELFDGRHRELSPIDHVRTGIPPIVMFHGTEDNWVPYSSVRAFSDRMQKFGNNCQVVTFSGRGHHFYNHPEYLEARPRLASLAAQSDFATTFYLMERFLYEINMVDNVPVILPDPVLD